MNRALLRKVVATWDCFGHAHGSCPGAKLRFSRNTGSIAGRTVRVEAPRHATLAVPPPCLLGSRDG